MGDDGLVAVAVVDVDFGRAAVAQAADHGGKIAHEILSRLAGQRRVGFAPLRQTCRPR